MCIIIDINSTSSLHSRKKKNLSKSQLTKDPISWAQTLGATQSWSDPRALDASPCRDREDFWEI